MSGELFRPDHGPIRANCPKLAEGAMLVRGFAFAMALSVVRCEKLVWAGRSGLAYHGVETLADGDHPLSGRCRFNLTFPNVA